MWPNTKTRLVRPNSKVRPLRTTICGFVCSVLGQRLPHSTTAHPSRPSNSARLANRRVLVEAMQLILIHSPKCRALLCLPQPLTCMSMPTKACHKSPPAIRELLQQYSSSSFCMDMLCPPTLHHHHYLYQCAILRLSQSGTNIQPTRSISGQLLYRLAQDRIAEV
ncbi:hypothetical protein COCC4DRAFT_165243 [Bipolaris maydis ATCC 48331]|uniref:Uncharacterized protein n=2 Tax=Cochliobolus heterostrophus TaxID=5016 RepID=M2UHS8_COCH5|nr:uncharacterized protein COCC4DRAFT_165243 [Bipolaris maydis ATCC 48331]EMD93231.1 hypothetical protein COCHEDRAFT_1192606 [Bipolaris maydis C5]ENI07322.1 hypothetical protein COCC4DRAFT_165243 [Bipolaris maydis ATCC 48331]